MKLNQRIKGGVSSYNLTPALWDSPVQSWHFHLSYSKNANTSLRFSHINSSVVSESVEYKGPSAPWLFTHHIALINRPHAWALRPHGDNAPEFSVLGSWAVGGNVQTVTWTLPSPFGVQGYGTWAWTTRAWKLTERVFIVHQDQQKATNCRKHSVKDFKCCMFCCSDVLFKFSALFQCLWLWHSVIQSPADCWYTMAHWVEIINSLYFASSQLLQTFCPLCSSSPGVISCAYILV